MEELVISNHWNLVAVDHHKLPCVGWNEEDCWKEEQELLSNTEGHENPKQMQHTKFVAIEVALKAEKDSLNPCE